MSCSVSSLSKRAIKGLPQLQAWKTFYMPVARHLSMCLTINPCLMNGARWRHHRCCGLPLVPASGWRTVLVFARVPLLDVMPRAAISLAVFLGISNLQKWVNVQAQGASVEILLQEYFYSFGVNTLPPAWRTATTSFWLMDPSAFNFTGAIFALTSWPAEPCDITRAACTEVSPCLQIAAGSPLLHLFVPSLCL